MNRTGLVIALLIGVGVGVVFGLWPQLDIAISRIFFDEARGTFPALQSLVSRHLRELFTYIVAPPGKARPTEFITRPGTDHGFFINQRVKPQEPAK